MASPSATTTTIQEKIDSIKNELKTLRLPHKLKQYKQYEKCLNKLKQQTATTNESSLILNEQIDELFIQLNKSVICGVDKCFLCSNSNNNNKVDCNTTSSSVINHQSIILNNNKQNNQQQQSDLNNNVIQSNDDMNDSDRFLQITREKLRSTSSSQTSLQSQTSSLSSSSLNNLEKSNNDDKIELNDKIDDDIIDNKIESSNKLDDNDKNIDENQKIIDNDNNIDDEKIKNQQNNEKIKIQQNNEMPSIDQNNNDNNVNKQQQKLTEIKINTTLMMPRPYKKFNINNNNNKNNGSSTIISNVRSPPIISSYKAYKDFINNYATAATK